MDKTMLGLKIKTLREHKKWSQAKLAEIVDISENTVSNIETGKSCPHLTTLIAISDALEVSLQFLVAKDNNINKICLEEIGKCMFMFDKSIVAHVMEYIKMCLDLDDEVKSLKQCKKIEFSWFKDII